MILLALRETRLRCCDGSHGGTEFAESDKKQPGVVCAKQFGICILIAVNASPARGDLSPMAKSSFDTLRADLTQPQLFLDDAWLADCHNVSRVWHQPRKYPEPVLKAETHNERNGVLMYGSVHRIDGVTRMWYRPWPRHMQGHVCYAESDDGVHFTRPMVGIYEHNGSKDNNIVMMGLEGERTGIDNITVIDDREHDSKWPFKALYWMKDSAFEHPDPRQLNIHAARSKDGIRWEHLGKVLKGWGDRFNALPTRHNGKFVVFGRAHEPGKRPAHGVHGRVVFRSESSDLKRWTKPKLVLKADVEDPTMMQIYSLSAWKHHDIFVGAIERMNMSPDVLDTEIAWSRDAGETWLRSRERPRFVPMPPTETNAFDHRWTNLSASPLIVHDNHMWFYYSGRSASHYAVEPLNTGAIGLAILRLDGFCSIRAEQAEGWLRTPTFTWPGGDLMLNADPRRNIDSHPAHVEGGYVTADVLDSKGNVIKGYEADACSAVRRNTYKHKDAAAKVWWGANKSLDKFAGKKVSLHFKMKDAHLYSFYATGKKG